MQTTSTPASRARSMRFDSGGIDCWIFFTSAPTWWKNPPVATKSFCTSTASSAAWAGETFCSRVDSNSSESAFTSVSCYRSRLRGNEFVARRDEVVGVKLPCFERSGDAAVLLEHGDRCVPILVRHPSERFARGIGRHPGVVRELRLPPRDCRHRRFREFLHDRRHLIHVLTAIQEALEARRDKSADELGILLDEIVVVDDAVAHRGHAAVGIPEDARLLVTADLDARHIALRITSDGGHLPGDQRGRAAGGIDVGDANLARIEIA